MFSSFLMAPVLIQLIPAMHFYERHDKNSMTVKGKHEHVK